jgi:5'-phosphate synthase pdxT subunit
MSGGRVRAGILALQGDVVEHGRVLRQCGADPVEVRAPSDLEDLDALVIPGGESTTMLKLIDRYELRDPLVKRIEAGLPTLGTCAGAIVLASRTSDGEQPLGVLDLSVRRNAYGSQRDSFEAEVDVAGVGPLTAVFIRAPVFEDPGPGAEVLATWGGRPVVVRSGRLLVTSFHPELSGTPALHRWFLDGAGGR